MADEEKDYQEDYYQLLKDESYKSLLSKEVQYDNARKRALKQTNASLGAMGMQSSGYGQTATSGIEGQYLQALEGANQQYQQEQMDIGMQEMQYNEQKEAEMSQQQLYDMGLVGDKLTQATSREQIDEIMQTYGLYDANGEFDYNKAVSLYGEQNARELQYLYNYQIKGIEELDYQGAAVSADDWHTAISTFEDQNGKTGKVNDELKDFFSHSNSNGQFSYGSYQYTPRNGDVLKISANSENGASTTYIIFRNGKWYQATASQYSKASPNQQHWFRSAKNSGSTFYFDNNKYSR